MRAYSSPRVTPMVVALVVGAALLLAVLAIAVLAQARPTGTAGSPAESPSPTPTVAPSGSASPSATPAPTKPPVIRAATNGVVLTGSNVSKARRRPLVVMVDDHPRARPQAGLSEADIVYHATAEYGIPRYMLVYQVGDAKLLGPIRSARRYFVAWATEWNPIYGHVGGSPDSLRRLRAIDRKLLWDADQYVWSTTNRYFYRTGSRPQPHNVYASTNMIRSLGQRLGAKNNYTRGPAWSFIGQAARSARPRAGTIVVPYLYNRVTYRYEAASNRYVRGVTGATTQRDAGTGKRIAPANVIVMFVPTELRHNRPGESTNDAKGRLNLKVDGSGKAYVLRNGELVSARWSKANDQAPTLFQYASGCLAGKPVGLVPGQIFIQVVPTDAKVTVSGQKKASTACPVPAQPTPSPVPSESPGFALARLREVG